MTFMAEPEIRAGQSIELLKALHILTRDGKMNQDSRRKLKQVYHLFQFIEPLLQQLHDAHRPFTLVDHGAGKSYLGFILYDLFFKRHDNGAIIHGIEVREPLVNHAKALAEQLGFTRMRFHHVAAADAISSTDLPEQVEIVTALHACDTATDDAISFALKKHAQFIVLVPCCQAEVAAQLRQSKARMLARDALTEIWRHPIHTREFGSHLTNVLRCLQLEAHGYQLNVTELVGWEHAMKNELIIATQKQLPGRRAAQRLTQVMSETGLENLKQRFWLPQQALESAG